MKKTVSKIMCCLILIQFFGVTVFADFDNLISENIEEIENEADIEGLDFDEIKNYSFADIIKKITEIVKENIFAPVKTAVYVFGMSAICFILSAFYGVKDNFGMKIMNIMSFITAFLLISDDIEYVVSNIDKTVKIINLQLPFYISLLTVSGKPASGSVLSGGLYGMIQIVSLIVNKLFLPFICGVIVLSFCESAGISGNEKSITYFIKKAVITSLSVVGTVFSFFMSVKNVIAVSGDNIAYKGLKFIVGSTVPIVGSAVSDCIGSVAGAVQLTRNTFGIVLIVCIVIINAVSLIKMILWKLSFNICGFFCELFDVDGSYFSSMNEITDIIIAVIVFSISVFVISLGLVISVK